MKKNTIFDLKAHTVLTDNVLQELFQIQEIVFENPYTIEKIQERIRNKAFFQSIHAYQNDRVIGFKSGYALDDGLFYSWVGGVDPRYRRQGIANELMITQHHSLKQMGYQKVRTKTQNKFKNMVIVNLNAGFEITDTFMDEDNILQIILEKDLSDT